MILRFNKGSLYITQLVLTKVNEPLVKIGINCRGGVSGNSHSNLEMFESNRWITSPICEVCELVANFPCSAMFTFSITDGQRMSLSKYGPSFLGFLRHCYIICNWLFKICQNPIVESNIKNQTI